MAAAIKLATKPNPKDPVHDAIAAAEKEPNIYKEPWAKFISPMTPKIRVKPAAIKNSIMPNCKPLRSCSKSSITSILASP
jgi:hypothetical protein